MRLLNTYTGEFEDFFNASNTPKYAILSHTWDPQGEQTYQDVRKIQDKYNQRASSSSLLVSVSSSTPLATAASPHSLNEAVLCDVASDASAGGTDRDIYEVSSDAEPTDIAHSRAPSPIPVLSRIWDDRRLSEKLRRACETARNDGYVYIWVDSSCIDKTSSSELSEAINSMYNWYSRAQVCYAFLSDVPDDDDVSEWNSRFRKSRWFTRGWTLQELIAPDYVVFLSEGWRLLGTKHTLVEVLSEITRIDDNILMNKSLDEASVSQRMSWAAERKTTRVEDQAYSLMGIFGINMPTLYGEGEHAFRRLQEEILRRIPEQSLFAWGDVGSLKYVRTSRDQVYLEEEDSESFFAQSPATFSGSHRTVVASSETAAKFELPVLEYTTTPYGLRMQFRLLPLREAGLPINIPDQSREWYLALLGCSSGYEDPESFLAAICYIPTSTSQFPLLYPGRMGWRSLFYDSLDIHMLAISPSDIDLSLWLTHSQVKTVYLPHQKRAILDRRSLRTLTLTLSERSHTAPGTDDRYLVSDIVRGHNPDSYSFILPCDSFTLCMKYLYMGLTGGSYYLVTARIWVLSPHEATENLPNTGPQSPAPYATATWVIYQDGSPSDLDGTLRNVTLAFPPEYEATLQLWFEALTPSLYDIQFAITSTSGPPPENAVAETGRRQLAILHSGNLKLVLLGRVRRALEAKGYAIHFEDPSQHSSNTHTLTLSSPDSSFSIIISYIHELWKDPLSHGVWERQEFILVARVTLMSEAYQDGPYVLPWADWFSTLASEDKGWQWVLDQGQVVLTGPSGNPLTLRLGFDLAWQSEYDVQVDVVPERGSFHCPDPPNRLPWRYALSLKQPHRQVTLTLPGHTRRALESLGFAVHFQGSGEDLHSLTLSNPDFAIITEYSHFLDNNGAWLTLRADVRSTSIPSDDQVRAVPHDHHSSTNNRPLQWVDTPPWEWSLERKEAALLIPRRPAGEELVLRLGFDLVWYSEYCLVVEATRRTSDLFSTTPLNADPDPSSATQVNDVAQSPPPSEDADPDPSSATPLDDAQPAESLTTPEGNKNWSTTQVHDVAQSQPPSEDTDPDPSSATQVNDVAPSSPPSEDAEPDPTCSPTPFNDAQPAESLTTPEGNANWTMRATCDDAHAQTREKVGEPKKAADPPPVGELRGDGGHWKGRMKRAQRRLGNWMQSLIQILR